MTHSVISSICESLLNPSGRFRTLKRIEPRSDHTGRPVFHFSSCTVDFAVYIDGRPHLLKIPLDAALPRIGATVSQAAPFPPDEIPFIAPFRYLEKELLVFDDAGRPQRLDLLSEAVPDGLPLRSFVRTNLHSSGLRNMRELLAALSNIFSDLERTGTVHGHIRTGNVTVGEGKIVLSGYIHCHDREAGHDRKALLLLSLLSYLSGCEPSLFHRLWLQMSDSELKTLLRFIQLQAEFGRHEVLLDAALTLSGDAPAEALHTGALLHGLSTLPFMPLALLKDLLTEAEEATLPDCAHDVYVPYYFTGKEAGGSCSRCSEYGHPNQTPPSFMNAEAEYGTIDHTAARDSFRLYGAFYEGRAAGAAPTGFGLLDNRGNYIMEPIYEALEWYGADNVAAACRDGQWNLYDRMGRQLTAHSYEWIAEPSEGICVVKRGGKFGYIHTSGRAITQMRFDEAFSFRDGRALVAVREEVYCIDREGKKIMDSTL